MKIHLITLWWSCWISSDHHVSLLSIGNAAFMAWHKDANAGLITKKNFLKKFIPERLGHSIGSFSVHKNVISSWHGQPPFKAHLCYKSYRQRQPQIELPVKTPKWHDSPSSPILSLVISDGWPTQQGSNDLPHRQIFFLLLFHLFFYICFIGNFFNLYEVIFDIENIYTLY